MEDEQVGMMRRLDRLAAEYTALPVHDDRTPDEIIGYDDAGVPTEKVVSADWSFAYARDQLD